MADIAGLFQTPEQYQLAQQQAQQAQAIQFANLNPMAQANYGTFLAGQKLGGSIGRALGGEDPQLKLISQRQQILGMIDPTNPDTYPQAIEAALQSGDTQAAYLLRNEMMKAKQQTQEQQLQGYKVQDYLTERGLNMQQRGLQANALELSKNLIKPDGTVDESVYNELLGYGKVGADIIDQRLKASQSLESQQAQSLARGLINPDGTRNKDIEQQLSTTIAGREILKKFAPETKELKKGEKLIQRTPSGGWEIVSPTGIPTAPTTGGNAINDLISGNAIHPTVLPYAQQLSKNFTLLDPEDQDKAIEKLTTINNTAMNREADRTNRQMFQQSTLATQDLTRQLMKLQIAKAQEAALKAADGKEIKQADATKLANQSGNVDKLSDLTSTFKPEFTGYATNALGEADIWRAGRSSDPKDVALYQWWQSYQDHINKVRNELFGAALTAPEKAEFEKAMVTKGMSPIQAKANLDRQAELAVKAYDKLDKSLRVQGYSKSALDILRPSASLPPLENFIIQTPNTNPSNVTGGRR